jgi:hypothetical protein
MALMPLFRDRWNRPIFPRRPFLLALLVCALVECRTQAQAPPRPAPVPLEPATPALDDGQELSGLLKLPVAKPRPAQGPGSVGSFIDSIRGNDAAFEIIVGQARILTVKRDITAGQQRALIAVGDPSVIEFAVLNPRQLRLTGMRVGVTELPITTAENETYSFEVHVVADLIPLEGKLR